MARVTADEVRILFDDSELTDPVVEAFIEGATELVTEILTGSGLSAALLKEIERWIAAHMIATTLNRLAIKEGAGGASITYTGKYDRNLSSSPYGQTAMVLDTTGRMAALGGRRARIFAIPSFS
jgi:hypothetical protein